MAARKSIEAIRHEANLRRKPMSEARFRRLMGKRLGSYGAVDVLEVMLELERARAVEREARSAGASRNAILALVKWCDRYDWGCVPKSIEKALRAALERE